MRRGITNRVDRVDHYFGDLLGHDRKRMRAIIDWKKGPTKKEIDDVCREILGSYTRVRGFSNGEGECIRFI